jgi:hypothetical protein
LDVPQLYKAAQLLDQLAKTRQREREREEGGEERTCFWVILKRTDAKRLLAIERWRRWPRRDMGDGRHGRRWDRHGDVRSFG